MTTPNLQLPEFGDTGVPSGADLTAGMRRLDAVVQLAVDAFHAEPPNSPALGDRVIVDPPGTGLFLDRDLHIAYRTQAGWEFVIPEHGWIAQVGTPPVAYVFDASVPAWSQQEPPRLQTLANTRILGATWVRGSAAIETPVNDVDVRIPFTGTIRRVSLIGREDPGECLVDIWKNATYPPDVTDSICADARPRLQYTTGQTFEDTTLEGWIKSVTAGEFMTFHLELSAEFKAIFLTLEIEVPL